MGTLDVLGIPAMPAKRKKQNNSSGSTTWTYEPDRMPSGPRREGIRPAGSSRWSKLTRRDARSRLTITIKYRGGAECWYHVEARGRGGAFPGVMALHDVMREINEGNRRWLDEDQPGPV